MSKKNKVVILIDEYDKPIIDHATNIVIASQNHEILKSFYDIIKGLDAYLHAIFVTGVSKFSKGSLFAGINNLNDISQKPESAALLGYTQQELEANFETYIDDVATIQKKPKAAIMEEMKTWYNGYRFSKDDLRVYNPFSILYYLKDKERANYWLKSGTPTFLVQILKNSYQSIRDFSGVEVKESAFNPFEITSNIPLIPLLYQTGHLTIDTVFEEPDLLGIETVKMYTLNYPNQEVREAFFEYMLVALTFSDEESVEMAIVVIRRALANNDIDMLCKQLTIMFSQIPFPIPSRTSFQPHSEQEDYYYSIFHMILCLLDVRKKSEIVAEEGCIDIVIDTKNRVFILEFEFNNSADKALEQINHKEYYEKYRGQGKPITIAGIAFGYKEKTLELAFVQKEL